MHKSDEKLVEDYNNGDKEALEELVRRYMDIVFSFVYKYVPDRESAEDITQEVFVKVWRNIGRFKSGHKFKSWLYAIAKNTALDQIKKKKAILFSSLDNIEDGLSFADTVEDERDLAFEEMVKKERARELAEAEIGLPPAQKKVLDMHYREGLKFREIAAALRESIDTIKTRNRRALLHLKKKLSR